MSREKNYVPIDKRTRAILNAKGFTFGHISVEVEWHGPATVAKITPEELRGGVLVVQLPDGKLRLMIETRKGSICADIVDLREGPDISYLIEED